MRRDPRQKGHLLIDHARLICKNNDYFVELKVKGEGILRAYLLYGKQPQLKTAFFSCPWYGFFVPRKVSFIKAYEVAQDLRVKPEMIDEEWDWEKIRINISSYAIKRTRTVDKCEALLDVLEEESSASQDFIFLWDKSRVNVNRLEEIASHMEQGKKYHIHIRIRHKNETEEIVRKGMGRHRELIQKISFKEAGGQISGGEIWIGTD